MSLRDAAAYALRTSPQLDSSQRATVISGLQLKNTSAAFLPSLDLSSTHGLQKYYPRQSTNEPWTSSFSLTLAETLYDNGESLTKHKAAGIQDRIARLNFERDRDQLLLAVANAFFSLSQAKKTLEIQQEQHAVLKLQVELVKDAYKQGVKTRKDYLRFLTQLNRSDIDLITARDTVTKAEIDLRRALGVPLESGEKLDFAIDDAPPAPLQAETIKIENHRDYKIAELQNQVSDLNTDLVNRKLWPVLGVTASATHGSSNYLFTGVPEWVNRSTSWNALLTLSYNFFDFGTRRRNAEIAAEQASVQANMLTSGLLDLHRDIEKLQLDLRRLAETYRLSEELFKLERSNLMLITNEYRQGKVQYLDYITQLQNFASAKTTYYSSLYELRKGQLAERYHEGSLYEAILGH